MSNVVFKVKPSDIETEGFYSSMAIGQKFDFQVKLPKSVELTVTNQTNGTIQLTMNADGKSGSVVCIALGAGKVDFTAGGATHSLTFNVEEYFVPITVLTPQIVQDIHIHDTCDSLCRAGGVRETKVIWGNDNLVTLYYIKSNDNPLVYKYTLHALASDIAKFNLLQSIAEE